MLRAAARAALVLLPMCSGGSSRPTAVLDETHGSYRGVRIGSSAAQVRSVLGAPTGGMQNGFHPTAHGDVHGPYAFGVPGGPPAVLAYPDDAFVLAGDRVFGILAAAHARTARGVAIGDPLARARAVYPSLECRQARAGEAIFGADPTYTVCRAKLGPKRMLVFEEDPIRSITVLDYRRS